MNYNLCDLDSFFDTHKLKTLGELSNWKLGIAEMIIFSPNVYRCFIYKIDVVSKNGKYISIGNFSILQEAQVFVKKFGELFNILDVNIFTPKRDKNGDN